MSSTSRVYRHQRGGKLAKSREIQNNEILQSNKTLPAEPVIVKALVQG
jgi:hypothetical protein